MTIRSSSAVFALACVSLGTVVYCQSAALKTGNGSKYPNSLHAASYDKLAQAKIQGLDRKVSAKFENASLEQILKWLSNEKLNFVASQSAFGSPKITLNFENVALGEALDSIASLFGAHWERRGEIFVLKSSSQVARVIDSVGAQGWRIAPGASAGGGESYLKEVPATGEMIEPAMPGIRVEGRLAPPAQIAPESIEGFASLPPLEIQGELAPKDLERLMKDLPSAQFKVKPLTGLNLDLKNMSAFKAPMQSMIMKDGKAYKIDPKTGKRTPMSAKEKAAMEKEMAAFEQKMKAWGEKHGAEMKVWGEKFSKEMEAWSKAHESELENWSKAHGNELEAWGKAYSDDMKAWREKAGQELEKGWSDKDQARLFEFSGDPDQKPFEFNFEEGLPPQFFERIRASKDWQKLSAAERAKLEKDLQEVSKQLKGLNVKGARGYAFATPNVRGLEELRKSADRLRVNANATRLRAAEARELATRAGDARAPMMFSVDSSMQIEKLLNSLTDAQKEMQNERGYLKWSDLTDAQKKFISISGDGDFTISYSKDGRRITIKRGGE